MQLPAVPATGPIYTYMQTINQVLRLLPIRPFYGLSGRFLFIGYVGHAHQLSPVYWPEEYFALVHPPHDILRHVGFLCIMNDNTRFSIYEIESSASAFLNDCRTNFCAPNSHGGISPIWLLDQLAGVQFTPAIYPHGFPPPAPPMPVNILAWQTSFPQLSSSQAAFCETMFHPSLDFEYEPTIIEPSSVFDILPTPTLPDDDISVSDMMTLVNTHSFSEAEPPHPDLPWKCTAQGDPLDKGQKLLLKGLLAASPWGRLIKLAKYLFIGHFLVGMPANPFLVPEAISRQLITTSFLRALRFYQKTYDEVSSEPLMIVNGDGQETIVGWSYLHNRFQDFYIDVTSELRKITRGSTSSLAGFAVDEDVKMQKILELIVTLNSDDQRLVQGTICDLIGTQAFKEVLWAALLRPITELAEGTARLADLYPDTIQTWMGYLRKGIVGVLTTLMYQAFTLQIPSDSTNLKAPELYPRIMAALDEMYMHPDRFAPFFQVAPLADFVWLYLPRLFLGWSLHNRTLHNQSDYIWNIHDVARHLRPSNWQQLPPKHLTDATGDVSGQSVPEAATTPRPPGPIRQLMRFCADAWAHFMQWLISVTCRR
ncbi:hypothetical protein DEU56DRAFT_754311 [Suillus clintonianus]|uniref:uncharacterized protein n=1 Tax=Suillus clintonianus TaxID=1904413 RepID=UPI001B872880|nr:uncharacterized protein DEU56DRAFT_754311 [Suillus clintonianus]KAG2144248.1 hypothetical protein DEU56DRAFT_754311 [Suillus clintonianus]